MVSSAYNKSLGRKGQQEVREILLKAFPDLEEDDIYSRPMGSPGEDLMLSPKARKYLPFDIEVKHAKKINMIRACQQAEAESRSGYKPLAIGCYRLEKPKTWYVTLKLEDFLELLTEEPIQISDSFCDECVRLIERIKKEIERFEDGGS